MKGFLSSLYVMHDAEVVRSEELAKYKESTYIINYEQKKQYYSIEELAAVKINLSLMKRLFDILFSLTFLIFVASWLFVLVGLMIKLDSRGSVFFVQKRRGRYGTLFNCLKFRTMCMTSRDTDEHGTYLQATLNDVRITKVGSLLRKMSLDELPQFFNILLGDMSVVGPRPHPEPLNEECQRILPYYWKRHLIKPGLTGLAQVKGYRGETQKDFSRMEKRVLVDLIYIRRWNFWLDMNIIITTITKYPIGF